MIKDEAVLRLIIEAASPRPDDTLLDFACGPGLVLCAFAPRVRQATGIDQSSRVPIGANRDPAMMLSFL
jgi:predicted TPR repeat methyltransferase